MRKTCLWAMAGLVILEGASRVLTRPWPVLDDFSLRLETLSPAPQADGSFRVLLIGDSTVYGQAVSYTESYPALLERLWQSAHPAEPVTFVNGGANGLTTLYGVRLLPMLLRRARPQVVVISFGLNDSNFARSCLDGRLEAEFMVPPSVQVLRHSRLFVGLERRWRRWNSDCGSWEGKRWEPRVFADAFVLALLEMAAQVRRHGADPVFLTSTPVAPGFRPELDSDSRERLRESCSLYNALIRDTAHLAGAGLLDVYASLRLDSEDWWEDGVHLTASGYRKMAAFLFAELEPRLASQTAEG